MELNRTNLKWTAALTVVIGFTTAVSSTVIAHQDAGSARGQVSGLKSDVRQGVRVSGISSQAPAYNNVIQLLHQAICFKQNSDVALADTAEAKAKYIQAANRAIFSLLPQEHHEDQRRLLNVEEFAPDKEIWRQIVQTRSLVKALAHVSKPVDQAAGDSLKRIWGRITHPSAQDKKMSGLLAIENPRQRRMEAASEPASANLKKHRAWLDAMCEAEMKQIYSKLSKEQRREWDAVLTVYKSYSP